MQMKEKKCLTGFLLGKNHGCITTNPNQSVLQCSGSKRFTDEEIETEVRNWRRHQRKDLYAAGFDALVKRWDKCINVCGGYVEK
jgi:hypothetical protein